jgi:Ca-activated chloride channel family protein
MPAAAAAPAGMGGPAVRYRDVESDREVAVESVQIVGNETLYRRGNQWFAASAKDVDLKRDADKIKTVERFSDEYFKLVAANTPAENTVLSRQQAGEELIVKLRGQIYLIR